MKSFITHQILCLNVALCKPAYIFKKNNKNVFCGLWYSQHIKFCLLENKMIGSCFEKKHYQTHKIQADIIETSGALRDMRSGAPRPHIGSMQRRILCYIWRHNFFP